MTGAQLLLGCITEPQFTPWTSPAVPRKSWMDLDPHVADIALATIDQLSPVFVANGFAAPSLHVDPTATTQTRLLTRSSRQP